MQSDYGFSFELDNEIVNFNQDDDRFLDDMQEFFSGLCYNAYSTDDRTTKG